MQRAAAWMSVWMSVLVLSTACGSDGRDPADDRSLDERIADAVAAGDPVVALGCESGSFVAPVWDFEGAVDAPSPTGAADLILAEPMWSDLEMPDGDRSPVHEATFRIGRVEYLPVLVDGELRVLLGFDAQGPDRWSISGGIWCDATP